MGHVADFSCLLFLQLKFAVATITFVRSSCIVLRSHCGRAPACVCIHLHVCNMCGQCLSPCCSCSRRLSCLDREARRNASRPHFCPELSHFCVSSFVSACKMHAATREIAGFVLNKHKNCRNNCFCPCYARRNF